MAPLTITLVSLGIWLTVVGAALGIFISLPKVPGAVKSFWSFWKAVGRVIKAADYELHNNGGGSMKDHGEQSVVLAAKAVNLAEKAMEYSKIAMDVSKSTDGKVDGLSQKFEAYTSSHALIDQNVAAALKIAKAS